MSTSSDARVVHAVADRGCELHQEWPTKPSSEAHCPTCRMTTDLTFARCEVPWCRTTCDLAWDAVVCEHHAVTCQRCHPRDACMQCDEEGLS